MHPPCLPTVPQPPRRRLPLLLALCASLAALLPAATPAAGARPGAALADPTRPPAALAAPGVMPAPALPQRANPDTARAIAAAARAADAPPPAALPSVQAVYLPILSAITRPQPAAGRGAPSALVDGRQLRIGDLLDGRPVLAIDPQGLLLKGPQGPQRLWLLAGSAKQAAGSISDTRSAHHQAAPPPANPTTTPSDASPTLSLAARNAP